MVGEVGEVGAEHGVDLVLDAAQLAFAGGVLDLAAQPARVSSVETTVATKAIRVSSSERSRSRSRPGFAL
jgi:hypothetical protein